MARDTAQSAIQDLLFKIHNSLLNYFLTVIQAANAAQTSETATHI